ncbi:MAG: PorT family protein, partial [Bacteroidales bacterium]|nr:PorT family protein [Bacteroidales bacterium]
VPRICRWNNISSSLIRRRRGVVLRRGFGSLAAVAAAVALFFVMGGGDLFTSKPELPVLNASISPKDMPKEKIAVVEVVNDKKSQSRVTSMAKAEDVAIEPDAVKHIIGEQVVNKPAIEENAGEKTDINKEVKKEIKEKIENGEKKTLEMVEYEESVNSKRFKLNKPLLAFSTMLSPSVSSGSMELLSRANIGHKDMFSSMDREQIPYENLYDTKYLPPVSVGFQIVLPVDKRVSFGTGINYTLLYSYTDVQNRNGSERQEQTVHYIGIPFNLYINILESKGFRLYANTGVMLEKGLALRYKVIGDIPENHTQSVSGVQWSVGAGIGGEYMIHKKLGLYADPSVSYFFPGGQPITVRTVQPLQFKFEVGLRFHL